MGFCDKETGLRTNKDLASIHTAFNIFLLKVRSFTYANYEER